MSAVVPWKKGDRVEHLGRDLQRVQGGRVTSVRHDGRAKFALVKIRWASGYSASYAWDCAAGRFAEGEPNIIRAAGRS